METKILYLKVKKAYGRKLIYPLCRDSRLFVRLLQRKTLISADFPHLRDLGYTLQFVDEQHP